MCVGVGGFWWSATPGLTDCATNDQAIMWKKIKIGDAVVSAAASQQESCGFDSCVCEGSLQSWSGSASSFSISFTHSHSRSTEKKVDKLHHHGSTVFHNRSALSF